MLASVCEKATVSLGSDLLRALLGHCAISAGIATSF